MVIITLAAVVLLIIVDRQGWLLVPASDDLDRYHGVTAAVTRVIDGDTFEVDLPDPQRRTRVTRVRLWGVDCPEMRWDQGAPEPFAREATELARTVIGGREVMLQLEPGRTRGSYGRVLAHVRTTDGTSLNEALLEAGLARADKRWPHAMSRRYAQLEHAARRAGAGIWSN